MNVMFSLSSSGVTSSDTPKNPHSFNINHAQAAYMITKMKQEFDHVIKMFLTSVTLNLCQGNTMIYSILIKAG